jgi:predicted nucleic acid-binding protein
MADGRLGSGECAAIACAINGGHALAIDDRKAAREALRIEAALTVVGTADLIVQVIREGLLSVAEADAIKSDWETHHRFKLAFGSFAERM